MLFYKITGYIPEEGLPDIFGEKRIRRQKALKIMCLTDEFNEKNRENSYCFVSDKSWPDEITCGIAAFREIDAVGTAQSYLEWIGFHATDIKMNEITFTSWKNLLRSAERCNYLEDYNDVLESLELSGIDGYRNAFGFSECLVNGEMEYEHAVEKAEELMSADTLLPEIKRIFQGSRQPVFGHPVHYMIETDEKSVRKDIAGTLLSALYSTGRLKSRRYSYVDIDFHGSLGMSYDSFYKCCQGGAVVVNCPGINGREDDDHANSEFEIVEALSQTMLKYRHQVLTILCLPRECEKIKKLLFESLGSVSCIEIREDLTDYRCACEYLKKMCSKLDVDPDEGLYRELSGKGGERNQYLPDELQIIFDEWYSRKLKTDVFPQYREIVESRKEAIGNTVKGNAYDDLNEMIGLSSAKKVIMKALNYYKLQRLYKEKGIKQDRPTMHMVFTGNPGTAKTTVARLFARIMKENGLLSKGHIVEVGRGDLVGKYVGWTAPTVQNKFKAARGGVLFIDEAYSLVDDRDGCFGDEAINTIVQEMENYREDMIVIFAGYPDKMEQFLNKNPGLRSRIAFHVPFADYDTSELCDIARMIGKSKGIRLTEGAVEKLAGVFDEARKQMDFGNGRYVRNIIELSRMNQAERILSIDPDEVTENILTSVEGEDIETPVTVQTIEKRTIGFAV